MKQFLSVAFAITSWRDCAEIFLISSALYVFMLWLRQDRHKNLLAYLYGYWAVSCASYALNLPVVGSLLCSLCPVFIMLFIVIHQISLQKNFVALSVPVTPTQHKTEWLTMLMRTILLAVNNGKEIRCIIQQRDALDTLIEPGVNVQAPITCELLAMLIESNSYNQDTMIWLSGQGTLLGINVQWHRSLDDHWVSSESHDAHIWEHHALLVTSRNDAIALRSNPKTQTCTLIIQGKIKEQLSAAAAIEQVRTYLHTEQLIKGDLTYVSNNKKSATQQHNA